MSKLRFASILFLVSTAFLKFSSMLRDLTIAGLFGSSYKTDAYIAAMTIPNAIVLFMLTGMKDAFLPSYYKYDRLGKGFSHLTNIVKGTFWISLAISIVGTAISPWLVRILYPKFGHYAHGFEIASWTAVLYFLSIALVGVNAVYEGYFDSQKKFSFSTFSQTVVVLATVGSALVFHKWLGIYSVPIGYFVGTFLSFLIKLVYLKPSKFLNWRQKIDIPEVKMFYSIFWPVGLTIAVGQINLSVNMLFAAQLGGGVVSNLNYAFRLVNIPQAIFGVTIATIVYPILAQAKADKNDGLFRLGMERGLSYMYLFLAPTVAGMLVLMEPIVKTVYERGAFDAAATSETSKFAIYYVGSVLFYSIQAVVAKGFYTLEKGHLIMRIGLISIVVNVVSNYVFGKLMGPSGLALSSSIVAMVYSTMTFSTLYKISGGFDLKKIGKEYWKVTVATIIMSVLLILIGKTNLLHLHHILYLAIMIIIGALLYFLSLAILRSGSFQELLAKGGKRKSSI
ncbi:murein biosynthesis integral membrane protein MurJ [Falsibacillus pallidus]|uniref:murein biosynthesis integral membrane protein MurJ n=1 Tax=Falsibacillus pallidus TaxID=493781 RepID=UPI003D987087